MIKLNQKLDGAMYYIVVLRRVGPYSYIMLHHRHTFFRRRGHLFFELPVVARMHCAAALVLRAPRAAAIRVILVFLRAVVFSPGWKNRPN